MSDSNNRSAFGALFGGAMATGSPMLLIAAVLIMFSTLSTSSSERASSQESEPPPNRPVDGTAEVALSGGDDSDIRETLTPLWRFAGIAPEHFAPAMPGNAPATRQDTPSNESLIEEVLSGASLKNKFIAARIATLPDPLESQAEFEFDMGLEAIQRAIESEGFVIDQFSDSWRPATNVPASPGNPHRRRPACLLFRNGDTNYSENEPDLILLLVVGESPTWGIQQGAMRKSLEIARLVAEKSQREREPIKVLGPTYSGSAASLARTLSSWLAKPENSSHTVWVCSGSATGVNKASFENLATPVAEPAPGSTSRVIYHATVYPDELMLDEVLGFLANPDGDRDRPIGKTVMLVEAGTHYGNYFFRYLNQFNLLRDKTEKSREALFIPFPRRISYLRGIPELTKGYQFKFEANSQPEIPLAEGGASPTFFPPFDPPVTSATDSLILIHILATIAKEEARYVGILASEVRNVLFLVQMIRQYCPDVQIFLLNNDILFTYEDFSAQFHGTIIASSYPLDSRMQRWTFPREGGPMRRLFANEFDIGRYNAFLVLHNGQPHPHHKDRVLLTDSDAEDLLLVWPRSRA